MAIRSVWPDFASGSQGSGLKIGKSTPKIGLFSKVIFLTLHVLCLPESKSTPDPHYFGPQMLFTESLVNPGLLLEKL